MDTPLIPLMKLGRFARDENVNQITGVNYSPLQSMYGIVCLPIELVVSSHLKNISQHGNLPQVGVNKNHIWLIFSCKTIWV